jgi:hypothetical protein
MEIWNFIYYSVCAMEYRLHLLVNKINPILILYNTKKGKRKFAKRGIDDPVEAFNKVYSDPKNGIGALFSSGFMYALIVLSLSGVFMIKQGALKDVTGLNVKYVVIVSSIISYIINHYLLFRSNRYLKYFKKFTVLNRNKKLKLKLYSILIIVFLMSIFVLSFFI